MTQLSGNVDTRAARRLADTIGMMKVVLISLIVVVTALGAMADSGFVTIMFLLCGTVAAVFVYAVFGFLEQALLLLSGIADNTADRAHLLPHEQG